MNYGDRRVLSHRETLVQLRDRVHKALELMTTHRIRHLPVMDNGAIIGIVSIGDLVKNRIEEVEFEADSLRSFIAS